MKHNSRNVLAFAACLLMSLAFSGNAFATNHVTSCGTVITTSGLWLLDNDLTCTTGDAIDIQVGNVILKLQGHTMTGSGGVSFGVLIGTAAQTSVKNVTILGPGTITSFGAGIGSTGTVGGGVVGVTITHTTASGMVLNFDFVNNIPTSAFLVSQNTVSDAQIGISCNGFANSTIVGNNTTSSSFAGIQLYDASNNTVSGNISTNNGTDGLQIGGAGFPVTSNTITGNLLNSNLNFGISVQSGDTSNHFSGNVVLGNPLGDIFEGNAGCATETYRSNVFGTANQTCVR